MCCFIDTNGIKHKQRLFNNMGLWQSWPDAHQSYAHICVASEMQLGSTTNRVVEQHEAVVDLATCIIYKSCHVIGAKKQRWETLSHAQQSDTHQCAVSEKQMGSIIIRDCWTTWGCGKPSHMHHNSCQPHHLHLVPHIIQDMQRLMKTYGPHNWATCSQLIHEQLSLPWEYDTHTCNWSDKTINQKWLIYIWVSLYLVAGTSIHLIWCHSEKLLVETSKLIDEKLEYMTSVGIGCVWCFSDMMWAYGLLLEPHWWNDGCPDDCVD